MCDGWPLCPRYLRDCAAGGRFAMCDFVSRPNARPFGGQLAGRRATVRAARRLLPLSRVRKPSDRLTQTTVSQTRVFDAVGPFCLRVYGCAPSAAWQRAHDACCRRALPTRARNLRDRTRLVKSRQTCPIAPKSFDRSGVRTCPVWRCCAQFRAHSGLSTKALNLQ